MKRVEVYIIVALMAIAFTMGAWRQRVLSEDLLQAMKAQANKTHCTGEVTYPEMLKKGRSHATRLD